MKQGVRLGQQRSQRTAVLRAAILGGACLSFAVFWVVLHALPIDRVLPAELQQLGDNLNPSHPLVALTVVPERTAIPHPTLAHPAVIGVSTPLPAIVTAPTATSLSVPTETRTPDAPTAKRGQTTYTVQPGDTLYSIARRNNVSPQVLAELNGLPSSALVKVGQKLKLP